MSLQEAASSGSFNPHVAQPSDAQRSESAFNPPLADEDVDRVSTEQSSPFGNPYDFSVGSEDLTGEGNEPNMRDTRRRAWTVVGLAIIIPAAVAGVIAWQLFGGDAEPAPTVTRVTTTPAEPVAQEVQVASTGAVQVTVAAEAEPATVATASSSRTEAATSTSATESAAAASTTTDSAAAATGEAGVDLSSLEPAARLAAWTEIETIQVLPGETLWLIAQNYGTTISAIATLNGIADPELLTVGQELKIPVGFAEEIVELPAVETGSAETSVADEAGSTAITAASVDVPPLTDDLTNWHTIAPVSIDEGDSLAGIALANNTTVEAIMALNGITDPNLIFIGDTLLVPVGYQGDAGVTIETTQQSTVQVETETAVAESSDGMMETEGGAAAAGDSVDMMESESAGAGEEEDLMEEE